jgi:hypothetical protein
MSADRRQNVSTAAVGTTGVLGGALLRGTGVERARRLTGEHHHVAFNDIRRAVKVPHGRRAAAFYAAGLTLGSVSAPAAVIGASNAVRKDLVVDGFSGAAQALHLKTKTAVQPKPTKARVTGAATTAGSAALGTLAAHRGLDVLDARRAAKGVEHIGFKRRTVIAAAGGLAGTVAGIKPGAAIVRRVSPGYTLTSTGVHQDTVKKYASPGLTERCPQCGTRTSGPCPVCHEIPGPIYKASVIHLATGRGRQAACHAANATRATRSTSSVTCAACKRTHGYRSRVSVSKRTVTQNAVRWGAGIGTAGVAGVAAESARGKKRHVIADEAVGAAAGQAAYQGAGYGAKHYAIRQLEPQTTRSQRDKQLKPAKKKYGAYTADMERNYPRTLPEAPVHRALGWTHRGRTGNALGATITVAVAGVAGNRARAHNQHVSKASPLRVGAGYVARNWREGAVPAVVGTSVAGEHEHRHDRSGAVGAAAGAIGAESLYRTGGLVLHDRGKKAERTLPEGMSRSRRTKLMNDHRKQFGLHHGQRPGRDVVTSFHRSYPRELPGSGIKRFQGYAMSGKRGLAAEGALVGTGALLLGHSTSRQHVSKMAETPGAKRARIYAAGSTPGIGMITAARQAGREAPHSQRHQAAAVQYGGTLGAGVAGAYGLSHVANHVPAVGRGLARAGAAKDRAVRSGVSRITGGRIVPGSKGPGRIASVKSVLRGSLEHSAMEHPHAARRIAAVAKPLTRAGAPVALTGYTAGKFLGGQGAISYNQRRARSIEKAAPLLSRAEEERQIKRQRHNAALNTVNAAVGGAGVGLYGASLHPKTPAKLKGKFATAAVGTAIASGGLGSIAGFRGASAARHDARTRQARLDHSQATFVKALSLTPLAAPRKSYVAQRRLANGARKSYAVRGVV